MTKDRKKFGPPVQINDLSGEYRYREVCEQCKVYVNWRNHWHGDVKSNEECWELLGGCMFDSKCPYALEHLMKEQNDAK